MDEFLQRRYCRFVNRKKHKSKMNVDEGVSFKVRRFLQDIDKYNENKKKKKERKEAKIRETNISLHKNKGIYRNAVLSFPGIKELNCSRSARLKGDLIALTNKPNEENEKKTSEAKILEKDVQSKRETMTEQNEIVDKHSKAPSLTNSEVIRVQEIGELQQGLDNNEIDNNAEEDIIIGSDNGTDHFRSGKEINLVEGNKENHSFFSKLKVDQIMERDEGKHEDNCNKNFKLVSPKKKKGIFDFFNTPERRINLKYTLLNNICDHSTPKWEAFNENCPENCNSERTKHKSSTTKSLSKYIFELSSRNNDVQNNLALYQEISNQDFKNIQPNKLNFLQEGHQDKIKQILPEYFERINNLLPNFTPKEDVNESHKKPVCFVNYNTKFDQKRIKRKTKYMESIMKKYLVEEKLMDQYLLKKSNDCKKDLFNIKKPVLNYNQRFKNNLKFSPHKYC